MLETYLTLSIVISLIYDEWVGVSPSGMITPGYLALFLDQPLRVIYTFALALVTFIVLKALDDRVPLYGKRRFAASVTIALVLRMLVSGIISMTVSDAIILSAVGNIIPGLMANEMYKQGVFRTSLHTVIVTIGVSFILILMQGQVV